jgi:pimeloyl-ACP methyl ester carboxylesterase
MGARNWAVLALAAVAALQAGCVSQCHKTHAAARERGPDCDLPAPCRNTVHVFLIDGLAPTGSCGMDKLRTELAANGFAKVGIGSAASGFCVAKEIEEIRASDPEAKFVLVGYDVGGGAAAHTANALAKKGIAIEALVLLDPVACGNELPARTLLVSSGTRAALLPHTTRVAVPGASHAKLAGHPTTVAVVTDLLRELAASGYAEPGDPVPAWSYRHAPEMRPQAEPRGDGWDFLIDDRRAPAALRQPAPAPATAAAPIPARSTSAGAVTIRP